jgi:hypothetical protein
VHDISKIEERKLSAAWEELEAALREAAKLYLNQNDGGRAAAIHQLIAINRFISAVSSGKGLLYMPLLALSLALYYLNLGVVEPMLTPPRSKSRRGRRPEQDALKLRSAVAMSQLYDIGFSRKEAARRIASEQNSGKRKSRGSRECVAIDPSRTFRFCLEVTFNRV